MTGWNADLYKRALDFAARAHGDQRITGTGLPYVVHITKVAMEALRATLEDPSLDADVSLACALLHDCVEDTETTLEAVREAFGPTVAAGVSALTKNKSLPTAEQMPDSLLRLSHQPREVQLVKLADRITNLEPPPAHWSMEKRQQYLVEARHIRVALGESSAWLAKRIEEKMRAYDAYCR